MKLKIKLSLLSLLFLLSFTNLKADTILLASDVWCPYACDPNSVRPGYMVEIAKEIFEKNGHKVQYEVMNWARAIAEVKSGHYNGLIGASRADAVGFVIPELPTGTLVNYLFTNKNSTLKFKNFKSLQNKKIGVINNYSYSYEIDKMVERNNPLFKIVSGEWPLKRLIQMTENKRIDGFIENPLVLSYTLKELNKSPDTFKIVGHDLANDYELFIAFTPENPKSREYADMLDAGVIELRRNGRLKEILTKYGLIDWKK